MVKIGYLLPTREQIMQGRPEARPLLALAEKAEGLGFDSIWAGDSITARPRHDPITLLTAVAARTSRVELGTAVLIPVLRNPVVLAHQIATLDQISEGRVILGVGIGIDTLFDGWLPSGPYDATTWGQNWGSVQDEARAAEREPDEITGALYSTIAVDDDADVAERRLATTLAMLCALVRFNPCGHGSRAGLGLVRNADAFLLRNILGE